MFFGDAECAVLEVKRVRLFVRLRRELVVTLVKLFVMATLPMTQAAKDASRVVVDPHHTDEMKKTLHARKENAMKQVRGGF